MTLQDFERLFWRCGAIRADEEGNPRLITERVPGPALVAYRRMGGTL